jgi:ATP-dependent helicase/nuclease subunit B
VKFASLYQAAHGFLRDHTGRGVLVVAMERAAADHIVRTLGGVQLGIHRCSLRQLVGALAEDVLIRDGRRPLTALSAEALATQVVDSTPLAYFAPVARTPGFPTALVETLTRLRLKRQEPPGGDLRLLATAYQRVLAENSLVDAAAQLEAAIAAVKSGNHPLLGLPTLLVDLRPANALEREFIDQLSLRASAVESLEPESDCAGANSTALHALQRQIFAEQITPLTSREGVEFFSASGEALECAEITRRIFESRLPFDACAVLLRHPARYQPLVEDALRRAAIPAWFTRGVIRPDTAGRSFLALLHCADEGISASRFGEYLSHEQKEQPYGWERLLVDAAVIGGTDRWERRLSGLAEELRERLARSEDDNTRERIGRRMDRLAMLRSFALPLVKQLDSLRALSWWGEWLDALRLLAETALDDPDGVIELLQELEPMRQIGPVGLPAVLRVLSTHLGALRREPKGHRYGRVFVGSIEEARGLVFQLVCVPGLCEGAFPKPQFDDPLLPGNLAELEAGERLLLRQAIAPATTRVVLSWPRIELATGRLRVPSFYVLEAARAAYGEAIDRRVIERAAEKGVETRIGWPAPDDPARAIDETEHDLARLRPAMVGLGRPGLAAYLKDTGPTLYRSLRTRWNRWNRKWSTADGLILSQGTAPGPLAPFSLVVRPYSPSSLQFFASCPYRFALRTVVGLEPMEEATALERLDPLTRGILFHEIQKRLLQALDGYPAEGEALRLALEVLDRILRETAAAYAERLAPAIPQIWHSEVERLRTDLRGWLAALASDGSSWEPSEVERRFESAIIAEQWKLRGRMDLIEQSAEGAIRVTDYKTGNFPEPVPQFTGGGEVLQPALYALAAEQLFPGRPIAGGRLFYATLRGGYRAIDVPLNDQTRAEADRVLSTVESAVQAGCFPAAPREDACEYCDYLAVCGPYEEERVRRKPQTELESLIQLRSVR